MQRFGFALGLPLLLSACGDTSGPLEKSCTGLTDNKMIWVPGLFQERRLGTDHIGFRLVDNVKAEPAS